MSDPQIPFNRPHLTGHEGDYVARAIAERHLSGDGPFTAACAALLEQMTGAGRALLTPSCTHALELAALALALGPGDEVIAPAFTFPSTAGAFALLGARPVFCDVRPDTIGLDPDELAPLIGPRTRAIVVVHYGGVACDMDAIARVVDDARADARAATGDAPIAIIEDNAHGLLGRYRGRPLGSIGALATLSFHATKNLVCGEGGALLVNGSAGAEPPGGGDGAGAADSRGFDHLLARAEIAREKGTDRRKFLRGEIDKYTWIDLGSSWLPSELTAAFLCAQLERADAIQARRHALWARYHAELADWAARHGVRLPHIPPECEHTAHVYFAIFPSARARTRAQAALRDRGVHTASHYQPLHVSAAGQRFGGRPGDCPVTEQLAETLLRLPLYPDLSDADQGRVIAAVRALDPGG